MIIVAKRQDIDMLNGPMAVNILKFAIPLAATGMLQQLFNAADIAVIGRFVGKEAMAAVGSNSSIIGLLVNLFVGIALGANVSIAHYIGQKNYKNVSKAVHTAIIVAIVAGFVVMAIGELIAAPLLGVMSVPDEIFPMAVRYLRIYLAGMPVILLYNYESSIFRSHGDTRTPLICLTISGVVNVLLNIFFVVVLHMTVDGVALATVISNGISASLLFIILKRSTGPVRVRMNEFKVDKLILKNMLQIGVPAGIQGMVFSLSNVCIQQAINELGSDVMAASSAAFNVEILPYFLVNAFGQACTTFVGQNYGAGKLDRCRKATFMSMLQGILSSLILPIIIIIFASSILSIFNTDPEVIALGTIRLKYVLGAYAVNTTIEIMSGGMRGYGFSLGPALMSLFGICGVRIIWIYFIFPHNPTFANLLIIYPISWVVTATALIIIYIIMRKKWMTIQ